MPNARPTPTRPSQPDGAQTYGADRIRYLRCGCCGAEFSERKGTALFNCKIGEAQAVSVIEHLDRACGLNARRPWSGYPRISGQVSYQLHDRLVRDLHPMALQFDENGRMWRKNNGT